MSSPFQLITEYRVFGAEDVIAAQRQLMESFQGGELTVKEFNAAIKQNTDETRSLNRAQNEIRMTTRVQNYEMMQSLHVMQSIGHVGQSLMNIWQAYEVGQIRVERAIRDVTDAEKDVAEYQALYNQYLRDFGADSAYTLNALSKLEAANSRLKTAQEGATKAQNDLYAGYLTMALSAVGIAANIGLIAVKIQEIGGAAVLAKGGLDMLANIAPIIIPITVAIATEKVLETLHPELFTKAPPEKLTPEEKAMWTLATPEMRQTILGAHGLGEWWTPIADWWRSITGGQFGIPFVPETRPYLLHEGERVLTRAQADLTRERVISKTLRASVVQYNYITKEVDAESITNDVYRKILRKLAS
jgi:uncharacterized protein YoxC